MHSEDEILLASFGQLNRDDEFKIITKIISSSSQILVRKVAYTEMAKPHIDRLKINHERISGAMTALKNIRLVKVVDLGDNFVDFEYIKGRNVEYETFNHIISGDYEKAIYLIDRIFALIDSFSSRRASNETKTVQKINDVYDLPVSSTKYTNPGVIDLNLDNFILDPLDELVLFDYEWVFDQPISSEYIKTRLLYTFFARRSDAFGFLPSDEKKFKLISESGNQTLIPVKIYSKYAKFFTKDSLMRYSKAEDIFQGSVNEFHTNTAATSYKSFSTTELTSPRHTFPEVEDSLRGNYKSLQEHVINQEERIGSLETELMLIRSSTTYKIARKMASAKNKLSRKQS